MISIDRDRKQVTIGAEQELMRDTLRAQRLNWISIARLEDEMRAQVKIRHRHEPAWATLQPRGDDEVAVRFDEAVRAVTPGQAAVFYAGDEVIGGGWIGLNERDRLQDPDGFRHPCFASHQPRRAAH